MTNKIQAVVKEQGLEEQKSSQLMKQFSGYYGKAREIAKGSKSIQVKDVEDTETMELAREKRLELKRLRVKVEKTRKKLKAQSLREGRAIDGVANVIKALVVPLEEHLMDQEKYAERLEVERKSKVEKDRHDKLSKYVEDVEVYKLHPDEMSTDTFEKLLKNSKEAYEAKIKAEKEAEAERKEKERKQKLYDKRRFELAPLLDFTDFDLKLDTKEKEFMKAMKEAMKAKEEYEDKQEEVRKKAEKERKKREKLEAELEAKRRKEAKQKAKKEAERKAKEEAERKELLAPDKEKLNLVATKINNFRLPAVKSNEAGEVIKQTQKKLEKISKFIRERSKKL